MRILGAFYMRLVGRPVEVYQYLEPLYNDYRKIRRRLTVGVATDMLHAQEPLCRSATLSVSC